ncbi:putative 4-hydroxyphenylpyruvate dioxygenase [[Candida] jaroonii]|uniref:4-hydroxyphenylpyruvate dioxygenase n=1 Tax=[Candida] jaroonii TaxID=467808 RepID=A0ACA9YE85_9ASCO|nr:putative 4-hydroxyphenylpyruvate dioxygenase [[Candida] jaroonii]
MYMSDAIHRMYNLDDYDEDEVSDCEDCFDQSCQCQLTSQSDGTSVSAFTDTLQETSDKELYQELPFYPYETGEPLEDSTFELLLDGQIIEKSANDGFFGFHHITIVTSSAKNLSKLFQLTMGFEEIASKTLETGSRSIAAHVIRNGDIVIEFVNTLNPPPNNPSMLPQPYQKLIDTNLRYEELKADVQSHLHDSIGRLFQRHLYNSNETFEILHKDIEGFTDRAFDEFYSTTVTSIEDKIDLYELSEYLKNHGEGIIDISFKVKSVDKIFQRAVKFGANVLKYPKISVDQYGSVKMATIVIPGTDIRHTLIENIDYVGNYLPHYSNEFFPKIGFNSIDLSAIDHCVENYSWKQMSFHARLYAEIFGFRKFWSVDEKDISTDKSSLRSTVMASSNGKIRIPINEPSKGAFKSQIEEFYDYNCGPGVQHMALRTDNIIETVRKMKRNGVSFNNAPENYYERLANRMKQCHASIYEDFEQIKELGILIDFDEESCGPNRKCNYILQIFTHPLNDRPTLFIEIIQRHHHNGFGKGTFKGLFETIEHQQRLRGNLVPSDRS